MSLNYFFFDTLPDEERDEELRLEERLTLEREEELFWLRDELILEEETLLPREDTDLERDDRKEEVEDELLEVLRLTNELALGMLTLRDAAE